MATRVTDTRERILDAGERLFAEHGYAGASVRALTAEAGTNLNAVNYHFGSKEGLFRAVVRRILDPINDEQLRRLADLEAEEDETGEVPPVERLIDAYASPFVDLLERDEESGRVVSRLVARVLADADGSVERAALDEIEEAEGRYLRAFARALPHLAAQELWWRFRTTAVVAAFHRVVAYAGGRPSESRPGPEGDPGAWMLAYLAAAMCAPSGGSAARSRSVNPMSRE